MLTKKEIAVRLQELSQEMRSISVEMLHYDDKWKRHAKELVGASMQIREWVKAIQEESQNDLQFCGHPRSEIVSGVEGISCYCRECEKANNNE